MASQAQIDANRQNAKKSTGPKTAAGKRIVSQNALKHGLFAHEAVIHGESQADFELHREALSAEWRPVGPTESMLAERIVSLSWRLQRAERMQNQATDCMILRCVVGETDSELKRSYRQANGISPDDPALSDEYLSLGRIATKLWSSNAKLIERLFMHERRIESSLHRTMTYLKKLQIMRRIERDDATESSAAPTGVASCRGRLARASRGHLARDLAGHSLTTNQELTVTDPVHPEHKASLKKQTQFPAEQTSITTCSQKDYDNETPPMAAANKANQPCTDPVWRGRDGL